MQVTLNLTEIIVTFIVAVFGGSGLIAVFINHWIKNSDVKSSEIIKANERVAEEKTIYYSKSFNLLQTLSFISKGRDVNGDLDKCWNEFQDSNEKLQSAYVARSRLWKEGN